MSASLQDERVREALRRIGSNLPERAATLRRRADRIDERATSDCDDRPDSYRHLADCYEVIAALSPAQADAASLPLVGGGRQDMGVATSSPLCPASPGAPDGSPPSGAAANALGLECATLRAQRNVARARDTEEAARERLAQMHHDGSAFLLAIAGRPDIARLLGPHEKALFEAARQTFNAVIAKAEGRP